MYSSCIVPSHQVLENHELHLTDTKIDAHFVEMQCVVAAELTRLTQKVVILLYIVAEICIIAILGSSSEFRNFFVHLHITTVSNN